ncbi:hypothetical protein MARBORIA2_06370 [Methanobrevibacter arboriphilus]|uniref:hypothetical protein n=1 Tax=Methanobrevibacter arboriphilus TaxID=39441 RepID=UPI0022EEBBE0|nr:hypothetical protein [Methanobrevibacter arboriphilus]GLI11547.1 hypothetical protein MARBORIA2_06370 [Methanobrevibacter arboriphilus]
MKIRPNTQIKIFMTLIGIFFFYSFFLFEDNNLQFNLKMILPWIILIIILEIFSLKIFKKVTKFFIDTSLYLIILIPFILFIAIFAGKIFPGDTNSSSYIVATASIITIIISQIITNTNVNKQIKNNEKNMMFQMEYMSMKRALIKLNYFIDRKMSLHNNMMKLDENILRLKDIFKEIRHEKYFVDLPDEIRIIVNKNVYLIENPRFIHIYENKDCYLIPFDLNYLKKRIENDYNFNKDIFNKIEKIYETSGEILMYNLKKDIIYQSSDMDGLKLTDDIIAEKVNELRKLIKLNKIRKLIKNDIEKNY